MFLLYYVLYNKQLYSYKKLVYIFDDFKVIFLLKQIYRSSRIKNDFRSVVVKKITLYNFRVVGN